MASSRTSWSPLLGVPVHDVRLLALAAHVTGRQPGRQLQRQPTSASPAPGTTGVRAGPARAAAVAASLMVSLIREDRRESHSYEVPSRRGAAAAADPDPEPLRRRPVRQAAPWGMRRPSTTTPARPRHSGLGGTRHCHSASQPLCLWSRLAPLSLKSRCPLPLRFGISTYRTLLPARPYNLICRISRS